MSATEVSAPEVSVPKISVIVPTYNEAENITDTIDRISAALAGMAHEIIVVDDDSPDFTWAVADGLPVKVIRRFGDRGLSSAVLTGMATAQGETLAVIDADGQHDPKVLPKMVATVADGNADICVGTRSEQSGGSYGRWSLRRRVASWVASVLARLLLPAATRTTDPLSGYFVVSANAYERIAPTINPRGFKILLEFIAHGANGEKKGDGGLRIAEVGYKFRRRERGETKLSGAIALNYLIAVLDLRFGRSLSPVFIMFCLVGISGIAVALAGYGVGVLVGLPQISPSFTPALNPIHTAALLGVQLSIISNFFGNNYLTFHEDRYRGRQLWAGMVWFQAVSMIGVVVHVAVFQLLSDAEIGLGEIGAGLFGDVANLVYHGIALCLATVANFIGNVTVTWRKRGRGRRFSYG